MKRLSWQNVVILAALPALLATAGCNDNQPPSTRTELIHQPLVLPPEPTTPPPSPTPAPTTVSSAARPIQGSPMAPKPNAVLDMLHLVADWQLDNPTAENENDWIHSAFYDGVMALGRLEPDSRYIDAMMKESQLLSWKLDNNIYDADHHAVSQLYLELYLLKQQSEMIEATAQRFNYIIDFPKDDNLDFTRFGHSDRWSWCDSLFMDPPAWVMLSKATGDRKYLDSANRRWWVTSDFLYDKDEHLFYRDSTYLNKLETNGRKVFWSRGNGWVIAGLARILANLPSDYADRGKYVDQFTEMAERLKSLQQPDGLWRSSLLDPADHPQPETSGTGFITYALAWGINNKLLDHDTYAPVVFKAWDALTQCVEPGGKLIHVQPVGAAPTGFDPNSTSPFGVGAFLLAGSEVYQLSGGKLPGTPTTTTPAPVPQAGSAADAGN